MTNLVKGLVIGAGTLIAGAFGWGAYKGYVTQTQKRGIVAAYEKRGRAGVAAYLLSEEIADTKAEAATLARRFEAQVGTGKRGRKLIDASL